MTGLAEWLVAHRAARVTLIAALFPLPLLSAISAALIVLTTSARGWRLATQDVAAAALLLMAVTAAMGGLWFQVGIAALATWLVLAMLAELRRCLSAVQYSQKLLIILNQHLFGLRHERAGQRALLNCLPALGHSRHNGLAAVV